MCGIVGIVGSQRPEWLRQMISRLHHRGPDDFGEYIDGAAAVSLAMHRLSILDLTGGHQPMLNADGSVCIVFNGEIFNAPDLRSELERQGRVFLTNNSDTEVLLHLYDLEGDAMLTRLNGMFAFVLYDNKRKILFGARDPVGIKPLYYSCTSQNFAFGSELKSLLTLPWISREVNEEALFHYASLRFVPGPESILRNVMRLPAAHWFKYDLSIRRLEVQRYWAPSFEQGHEPNVSDWAPLVRSELKSAVQRWTLSDVPIGCSLSGGIDSSAIVGLLGESGVQMRTYSLGFAGSGEEEWNELPLARKVAERWGTSHSEFVMQPDDLLDELVSMVWSLDEPYGGGLPSWYIFRLMQQDVKVALTGTGGDEVFGDYGRFSGLEAVGPGRKGRKNAMWKPFELLASHVPDRVINIRRKRELQNISRLDEDPFRWQYFNRHYYFPDDLKRSAVFSEKAAATGDTCEFLHAIYRQFEATGSRNATAALTVATQLPEEFLLMTDRFSMAHSIEARVPFLDQKFLDFAFRIPPTIRTRPGDMKYLLKRAVRDLIPAEVLQARKRGFVIPTGPWLRGKLRPLAERLLSKARLSKQGLYRPSFFDQYVLPHLEGRADFTAEVWTALMFQIWHVLFVEEALTDAPTFTWRDLY